MAGKALHVYCACIALAVILQLIISSGPVLAGDDAVAIEQEGKRMGENLSP